LDNESIGRGGFVAPLTLVLGGVRSGKSRFAEQLAAASPPVVYLATAQAGDGEMAQRIAQHRQRRPPSWQTIEEPWDLPGAIADLAGPASRDTKRASGCVLVECLPLWLTNLMGGLPGRTGQEDVPIMARVSALADIALSAPRPVIVVSSEVGCGIVPTNLLARRFADLLGEANQQLAGRAQEVYALLAGIPLRIK
jgi:adenosylcobinamide kinase/adenosylcobinamide-phosphate guanylyltransferase